MSDRLGFARKVADGWEIRVRATPNAAREGAAGLWSDASGDARLNVRVRAIAEGGKANAAIEKLLSKALGVPRTAVKVTRGETHRLKTVRIATERDIATALANLAGAGDGGGAD